MRNKSFFILLIVCSLANVSKIDASSVKDLDKKIKAHRKELKQIHEQIRTVETEKGKLKSEEESLTKALKKIEADIERSTKKQVKFNKQIRETEKQIESISKEVDFFSQESLRWGELLLNDFGSFYVEVVYPQRLQRNPMNDWALRTLISLKYSCLQTAGDQKEIALQKENRLLNFKRNLTILKIGLQEEAVRQKKSKLEKKQLYKTTQGKRIIAEQETQKLRETSESLEELVTQLMKKKEKTLAAQREAELLKKSLQEKRGSLPWPVSGTVVSSFGKQLHPDLHIAVINNGIKIQTAPGSPVKSVEKGSVIYAADFRSYGQTVIVDHGGDTYSVYGLLGNIQVNEGEKVGAGKIIGRMSSDEGSQLYFEFRNQGRAENPLLWLK